MALYYTILHYFALHCIALHCIALHCIALHYIASHYITLHYITLQVLMPAPVLLLLVFLVRGLTLPGAADGVRAIGARGGAPATHGGGYARAAAAPRRSGDRSRVRAGGRGETTQRSRFRAGGHSETEPHSPHAAATRLSLDSVA